MLQSSDFLTDVKHYLRMRQEVTSFDDEINGLIDAALATLKVAGVGEVKSPLVSEFVRTFVRVRMLQDASPSFKRSELARENIIIQQLTYGGL